MHPRRSTTTRIAGPSRIWATAISAPATTDLLNLSATELTDTEDSLSPGAGFFYLITIREEGSLGFAACAERSNHVPCVP